MSEVQNTTPAPDADVKVAQPTVPVEETVQSEPSTEAFVVEPAKPTETAVEAKVDAALAEEKKDEPVVEEKKPIEPISEGQLAVKAPGFIKSIIPAKREFWLSDDAVASKDLSSYLRGEKAEVSHDVVAWASQTGKGLLFFNKKGESKKQPGHVLALYDATDLKKQSPHEISFRLNNEQHVLKATSDAERDGWYIALERAIETGKAIKDETRESEGYKAEKEKLNKPFTAPAAAAAVAKPKKSIEAEDAEHKPAEVEEEAKKDKKSRSTSRGVLNRLKSKKDEKKEEKAEKKEEEKEEKAEESKPEEENKTEEAAAAGVATTIVGGTGAAAVAESSEDKKEEPVESPVETKTEEKTAKPSKRGSIFGKMGFGSLKSPQKEKSEQDAELKPEVPPKDEPVSDEPPQIPATNVEPAEEPKVEESKPEEEKSATPEDKKDVTTPGKEKKNFLSGLSFMKRDRSVSPSANMKEAPAKTEEAAVAEVPKEPTPVEEGKADEAIAETTAVEPLKPAVTDETAAKAEKRQSMLGSLGRRASKAFKGIQQPKKETAAPATEATKEETVADEPAKEEPATNGDVTKDDSAAPAAIGDVVPEAVNVGKPENQPPAVAASA